MLRLKIAEPIVLSCMLMVKSTTLGGLNLDCATTGKPTNHKFYRGAKERQAKRELEQALKEADVDDFNFSHILDPNSFNLKDGGISSKTYRTANNAFFTLISRYNEEARKQGKDTIELEDIVEFIKSLPTSGATYRYVAYPMKHLEENPTGNDYATCYELKAPLGSFLKSRMDLGILDKDTADRIKAGSSNDMYVKLIITPTLRRGTIKNEEGEDEEVYVVETGIQPLSIHRDADSANTKPTGKVKDSSWDREEGLTPDDLKDATHRYIKDAKERRKAAREKEEKEKKKEEADSDETKTS